MSVVIFTLLGSVTPEDGRTRADEVRNGLFSTVAFILGASTSCLSGYLGMKIATYANARTALEARRGIAPAFMTAFRSGAVMGFLLASLGLLNLYLAIIVFGKVRGRGRAAPAAAARSFGGPPLCFPRVKHTQAAGPAVHTGLCTHPSLNISPRSPHTRHSPSHPHPPPPPPPTPSSTATTGRACLRPSRATASAAPPLRSSAASAAASTPRCGRGRGRGAATGPVGWLSSAVWVPLPAAGVAPLRPLATSFSDSRHKTPLRPHRPGRRRGRRPCGQGGEGHPRGRPPQPRRDRR
jgi:hypothetical protein